VTNTVFASLESPGTHFADIFPLRLARALLLWLGKLDHANTCESHDCGFAASRWYTGSRHWVKGSRETKIRSDEGRKQQTVLDIEGNLPVSHNEADSQSGTMRRLSTPLWREFVGLLLLGELS
jgi:hypothetical protein